MSDLKKNLNEIKNTISNQDEATKVMSIIMERGFIDIIIKKQLKQIL